MPDIKFAVADVSAMKLGTTDITKVMQGTVQIWPTAVTGAATGLITVSGTAVGTVTAGATCTDVITLEPFNNFTDNSWVTSASPTIVAGGRNGNGLQIISQAHYASYNIAGGAQSDTVTVGFAWRRTDAATTERYLCLLLSDSGGLVHNRLTYTPSTTTLAFTRSSTSIASNTAVTFTQNQWYYIEVQAKLHDTAGSVIVRVDGVEIINATSLDTRNAGTSPLYDQLRLQTFGVSCTGQWDDLYLSTGSGCTFDGDPAAAPPTTTVTVVEAVAVALSATRSPTITFTANPALNDVVMLFPSHTAIGSNLTIPSGWVNPLGGTTDLESSSNQMACVYHLVTSGEAGAATKTYTATNLYGIAPSGNTIGLLIRNVDPANVIDSVTTTFDNNNTATPHVLPGLTGTNLSSSSLVVACVAKDTTGSYTAPAGWTSQATSNSNHAKLVATRDLATTAGVDVTATNITPDVGDEYVSITLALTQTRYFKTALGNNALVATATSLAITTTAAIAIGDLVVVRVASDNLSASTPTYTCADSGGNTYTTHSERASGQASAGAGVAGGLMATKATNAVAAGGTITVTASATVTNLVLYAESFVGFNNTTRSTPVTAVGAVAGGTGVSVVSGTVNSGDLVVGSAHAETRTAPASGDADTLNGSWSTIASVPSAASGTDNLRTIVAGQYKIATASGAQTWDIVNGVAADWSAVIVVLQAA